MLYNDLEFFNAVEVHETGDGGLSLHRYPLAVSEKMNSMEFDEQGNPTKEYIGGREVARETAAVEIRLVTKAPKIKVTLKPCRDSETVIAWGEFFQKRVRLFADQKTVVEIDRPARWDELFKDKDIGRYNPDLLRICLQDRTEFYGIEVEGEYSAPTKEDGAPLTMFAYGTSITHGSGSAFAEMEYIRVCAREIGADVTNKGVGGSCFCEPEITDFVCSQSFDIGYFEIGTNISTRPEFYMRERLVPFIDKVCTTFANKPLFFMLPFPAFCDVRGGEEWWPNGKATVAKVIAETVSKYPNATLISGDELCDKSWYLLTDVLHPSPIGHIHIGMKLAEIIKSKI